MIKYLLGCMALICSGFLTTSPAPLARYGLDGNALDASGHGMNGSIKETSSALDRASHEKGALSFRSHSEARFPVDFTTAKGITISLWVWRDSANNSFFVINDGWMKGVILGFERILGPTHQEQLTLLAGNGTEWFKAVTMAELPVRSWFHLVGTIDTEGKIVIYVNGKPLASGSMQPPLTFEPGNPTATLFGSSQDTTINAELGRANDLSFYDKALSPSDVQNLYSSELSGSVHSLIFYKLLIQCAVFSIIGCAVSVYLIQWMRKHLRKHNEHVRQNEESGAGKTIPVNLY